MMETEDGNEPEAKRRKSFSKRETLQKLEELGDNVQKAASEMVSELSPFDVNDTDVEAYEEKIEKLEKISKSLAAKIYRLKDDIKKAKKFRKTPEVLTLINGFPRAVVSPSVHRILAHSWEVFELNGGYGLGDQSEEGLEALNKLIRQMRARGARKDSTVNNFRDTYNHLWDRSRGE